MAGVWKHNPGSGDETTLIHLDTCELLKSLHSILNRNQKTRKRVGGMAAALQKGVKDEAGGVLTECRFRRSIKRDLHSEMWYFKNILQQKTKKPKPKQETGQGPFILGFHFQV